MDSSARHKLLQRKLDVNGHEYTYVQAKAAIAQYDVIAIRGDGSARPVAADSGLGEHVAVAFNAIANNSYGWVCVLGSGNARTTIGTAVNTAVKTGAKGVHGGGTGKTVSNFHMTTASTAAGTRGVAWWHYPMITS